MLRSKEESSPKKIHFLHVLALAILLVVIVAFFSSNTFGSHSLVINEVMASNRNIIADEDGDYPDWIELYNSGSSTLNLEGFYLSDEPANPQKWQLPEVILEAGDYLLIFASGKDRTDPEGKLHTNFRLSADGDDVVLSTADVRIIDSVETEYLPSNISYGRAADSRETWHYFFDPTPGKQNSDIGFKDKERPQAENETVYINEFMSSNRTSIMDEDGDRPDWVEIHNFGEEAVNLKDYSLSDKEDNRYKWRFPDVTIEAGEYLLIFASGKNRYDPDGPFLHTGFRLNDTDDTLVFSTPNGKTIDEIKIRDQITDVSFGRDKNDKDSWVYFPAPTPGFENYTQGFEELSGETLPTTYNLHINEAMAMNTDTLADEDGEYEDWIELYNSGDEAVNLYGFGLSDKVDDPFRWEFPEIIIEPESYLLVFASGKDRNPQPGLSPHTNFRISRSGETLVLTAPTGQTIDKLATGSLAAGISVGRHPDGLEGRFFFTEPSPGSTNSKNALRGYAQSPVFSHRGGFYDDGLTLKISVADPQTTIRYTTDGKEPDEDSPLYSGPVEIDETTVIRARGFAEGKLPGDTANDTFFVDETIHLPVVSVMMDPKDLWDPHVGIYVRGYNADPEFPYMGANFWQRWEKDIHLQFFEPDGILGLSQDLGIRIAGQFSRGMDMKSFNVFARNRYGSDTIEYPFFPKKELTTQKAITLRTSGQDAVYTKIRDIMMTSLLDTTDLDYQAFRQSVLFINGEYWGIYNIRERINANFIGYNHNVNPDNVDLLQGNSIIRAGDNEDYLAMRDYVDRNDMRKDEHYAYVSSLMDMENFMDYWIAQIYFANQDSANIRFWREQNGGKWRWIVFDLDWGFFNVNHNTLAFVTHPDGTGAGRNLSTVLLRNLLKNDEFREEFIRRFAYHLNHTFVPERVIGVIDELAANIEPEMPRNLERWGGSMNNWHNQVQQLRDFAKGRPAVVARHVQRKFNLSNDEMEAFDAWSR